MTYYNTTNETGESLKKATSDAKTQNDKILEWLRQRPGLYFTPPEIAEGVGILLTSCRRALTDLTDIGRIEKTKNKQKGIYGKPNYCWRFPARDQPKAQFKKPRYRRQIPKGKQLNLPGM